MFARGPSLLITDDDRAFRETLRDVLRPKGFRTLLAGDGEEAVRIIHSEVIHLVLMDMHMPKLTGLEALRQVRQHSSRLPCILISADLNETILAEARQVKVFAVLSKPVTRVQVTEAVGMAMQQTYNWPRAG